MMILATPPPPLDGASFVSRANWKEDAGMAGLSQRVAQPRLASMNAASTCLQKNLVTWDDAAARRPGEGVVDKRTGPLLTGIGHGADAAIPKTDSQLTHSSASARPTSLSSHVALSNPPVHQQRESPRTSDLEIEGHVRMQTLAMYKISAPRRAGLGLQRLREHEINI